MAHRIALYSAKGGTGKTTTAINLAGGLNELGRDVCYVDLDPQGNATEGLGMPEVWDDGPPSLYDALLDDADPNSLVRAHEEMDVVPSNVDMLRAERDLVGDSIKGEPTISALDRLLERLEGDYDVIIIDCPPFFGEITDNALYAAGAVVIPALAESTSERAIELLLDQMVNLEQLVANDDQYEKALRISEVAAVANRVENAGDADRMVEWMNEIFSGTPVFSIRKRVALRRALEAGVSIFEHEEDCDMEEIYLELAQTVIDHFEASTTAERTEVNA